MLKLSIKLNCQLSSQSFRFEFSNRRATDGPYADNLDLDVLIVGAGFGGSYLLYEMRKQGYKTVCYDAGTSFGGTW